MSPDRQAFEIDLLAWWERLKRLRWWLLLLVTLAIGPIVWKVTVDESAEETVVTAPEYQVRVVNTIPSGVADEEADNSEPFLAVNPQNPDEMVISGHMLGWGGFCDADRSAVLRSVDRGQTWGLHCALKLNDTYYAGDISFAYSGNGTSLFGGFAPGGSFIRVHLIRTVPGTGADWPVEFLRSETDPDLREAHMPWAAANVVGTADVVAIGVDAVNVNNCNTGVVYWNVGTTSFKPVCVATRSSQTMEGPWTPVVRTAVHTDGTIYAATYRVHRQPDPQGGLLDVVVFRHDKGASTATPFTSLLDNPTSTASDPCQARDGQPGYRVARCVPVPFEYLEGNQPGGFGQERRLWTNVALATDPNDSRHLFVAWGDTAGPTPGMTLHVRESKNGGADWGSADLATVNRALNPALAVSAEGRLGFSYQRLEGSGTTERWLSEVRIIRPSDETVLRTFTLAAMPAAQPIRCVVPYLGDYMNLISVGNDFFGAFSASADITSSNFPEGIATPARNAPLADPVVCQEPPEDAELSIDPYFFAIERVTGTPGAKFLLRRVIW